MNKEALFQIGYGLFLAAANENGKDNACIVNTVMQITQNPVRVLVSINNQNLTHDMVKRTGKITLSVLTEKTPFSIYQHFGYQSGNNVNKFEGFEDVTRCANGIYRLNRYSSAYICGTVCESYPLDTHTMFLVEVTDADVVSSQKAVTYDYYQNYVKQPYRPAPKKPEQKAESGAAGEKKNTYVCRVCGYVYEGDTLPEDYVCPICKHGAADFEKVE
ncbi:MAG: flavin reductase [Lachnospiraceae bacterium]|nr:flavin reductase [Lachnospiraceae bacterium]